MSGIELAYIRIPEASAMIVLAALGAQAGSAFRRAIVGARIGMDIVWNGSTLRVERDNTKNSRAPWLRQGATAGYRTFMRAP